MDIVLIFNGLGNQMSQYGLYINKKRQGQPVKYLILNNDHNGIELERLFGIRLKKIPILDQIIYFLGRCAGTKKSYFMSEYIKRILRFFGFIGYYEDSYSFHQEVLEKSKGIRFVRGGWHHPLYFKPNEDYLRSIYVFPKFTKKENIELLELIDANKSVAIHIRRGDYQNNFYYPIFGCVCQEDYYLKAIRKVEELVDNPTYFVFSNDMEWSAQLMRDKKVVFVNWNKGNDSWADMALMSHFKYMIISNSTFSWWAAWLGVKDKTVFCPERFSNIDTESGTIFPEGWIRVK